MSERDWLKYFLAKRNMGAVICEGPEIEAACAEIDRLHSDYATLLARHNALVEAVRGLLGSLDNGKFKTTITHSVAAEVAEKVYRINRAEVDRLLNEGADCEGEG